MHSKLSSWQEEEFQNKRNHYTRHNQIAGANFLFLILLVDIGTHTSGATGILLYPPPGT